MAACVLAIMMIMIIQLALVCGMLHMHISPAARSRPKNGQSELCAVPPQLSFGPTLGFTQPVHECMAECPVRGGQGTLRTHLF